MSKECCKFHNKLPDEFEPGTPADEFGEAPECGLAGMGSPAVCCRKCPQVEWFVQGRGMNIDSLTYAMEECL